MRALSLLLALLPALVLAQPTTSGGGIKANCPSCNLTDKTLTLSGVFTSNVASGSNAIKLKQGAQIDFNSGTDTATLSFDGSNFNFSTSNSFNAVVGGYFSSDNGGYGFGGSGGLSQGMASSGSTTNLVCGGNGCLINLEDNSGHTYAALTSSGVDLTQNGTGVASTNGVTCSGSTHCGTQALTAGTASVTVVTGCHAICTDTTAAAAVKCSVSATTLTITGTSTDSINYFCF